MEHSQKPFDGQQRKCHNSYCQVVEHFRSGVDGLSAILQVIHSSEYGFDAFAEGVPAAPAAPF
jgi:hypothetical protein